jgi:hypothetical protein
MRSNQAEVKFLNTSHSQFLGKQSKETPEEVFADSLLLRKLRALLDSPPIADLFDFRFQIDRFALQ